jgi:hypothetical protein
MNVPNQNLGLKLQENSTMLTKSKIALSLSLVLATASPAMAAPKRLSVISQQRCTQRWCHTFLQGTT